MKILLVAVNAKYIHSNPAVYSLKAFADAWKDRIEIAEYSINGDMTEMLGDIYRRKPDVIAFSCYIWNWDIIRQMLPNVKKLLPDADLWLGGPEVSFRCGQLLEEYTELNGIMVGEGEETFAGLCAFYFDQSAELSDIAGLFLSGKYADDGMPFSTGERAPADLRKLPFIYESVKDFENRIIYYETQRGCPFRCSYCLSAIDKTVRFKPMEQVLSELQHLLDFRVPQVKFIDRTFNANHEHACTIWRFLREKDNGVTNFHFEIAADLLTDEEMEILKSLRPGLVQLEIGIQSTNPDTLRAVNRVTDIEKVCSRVKELVAFHNMHIHVDLIAGLPYENLVSFRKSYDDVFRLGTEMLQLGFLKVLKGSVIEADAERFGIVYRNEPPYEVLYTKWLSFADIFVLKDVEEMTEMYYNSNQYQNTLRYLFKIVPSPFDFFRQLAEFYRQNGYIVNQPSRMKRYEILREFVLGQNLVSDTDLLDELLTYDVYLRETVKSRPGFAKQTVPYRHLLERKESMQMHEEVFVHDILSEELPVCEPMVVEFHYDRRDALTNNAATAYRRLRQK